MTPIYQFDRGETIILALDAVSGDPTTATPIAAHVRPLSGAQMRPSATAPSSASFTITPRSAAGDDPAGWTLTIDAATSATLDAGAYYADMMFTIGGSTFITDGVMLNILEPATVMS